MALPETARPLPQDRPAAEPARSTERADDGSPSGARHLPSGRVPGLSLATFRLLSA
jgi:hypothetical protein